MSEQLLEFDNCGHCDDGPCSPECAPPYNHPVPVINKVVPIDWVNNPAHYNMGKYETIDIIEDADLGYHLSAALKYVLRCKYKGKTDEDLAKAVWYIERYRKLIHGTDTVPDLPPIEGNP